MPTPVAPSDSVLFRNLSFLNSSLDIADCRDFAHARNCIFSIANSKLNTIFTAWQLSCVSPSSIHYIPVHVFCHNCREYRHRVVYQTMETFLTYKTISACLYTYTRNSCSICMPILVSLPLHYHSLYNRSQSGAAEQPPPPNVAPDLPLQR